METKTIVIKFFAPVNETTINALMEVIDKKMKEGISNFTLLISSPGGSVFHGLSAYNYLKGLPVTITTHNFGSLDSISVILYCGGSERISVPQARFLLHGVTYSFYQNMNLEEKQLEEKLKELKIDTENIAKVISANTNKSIEEITSAMLERTTLNPETANSWGLVHEIKSKLFEAGSEVISIYPQQLKNP